MDAFPPADLEQVLSRIAQITSRFTPPPAPVVGAQGAAGAFGAVLEGARARSGIPPGLTQAIDHAASVNGLDPGLVAAVVQAESGGDPSATSDKGAMGLMQLMPQTAKDMGVSNPYDPDQNLAGGSRFLRAMIDKFGSVPLGIAAYNAGPGAVAKAHGIPPFPETEHYVNRVLDLYRQNLGNTRTQP